MHIVALCYLCIYVYLRQAAGPRPASMPSQTNIFNQKLHLLRASLKSKGWVLAKGLDICRVQAITMQTIARIDMAPLDLQEILLELGVTVGECNSLLFHFCWAEFRVFSR
mmetsp:Transcript_52336/g.93401  ORF Transcript_52336/g.93401 Transcript_52336/m.93401 type:complete len:110 (-) Transcript_52336:3676-4005(-)